ncbi:MAG: BlaI/MecI/CopY family transcriptional regulator [Candidatus Latescibacter sp.]|nr:BlaI/MecI/CopY family transcriptional regulator [Candidatus Latescibacter sp.]
MARRKTRTFTEVELEFMRILWDRGEAAPEDIRDSLLANGRSLSGGSIRNVLAIMQEKGYVARRKEGKAFLYRAKIREEQAREGMARNLLENAFAGSESLLVASLLERRDIRPEELEKIELLISDRRRREKS